MTPAGPRADSRRALLWLMATRAAVVTVFLGAAVLAGLRAPGVEPGPPFFTLIGVTYALTALYAVTLGFAVRHPWLVDLQLAGDAVIASSILAITGGINSYFASLYGLPIIAASVVRSWRGGFLVASLSAVSYVWVVSSQYGMLPSFPGLDPAATGVLPEGGVALINVGTNLFGLLLIAGLSGYLAESLRRTGARLERASSEIADLQAFSQHVIDSLASGLVTTDAERRILTFNRAASGITGQPRAAAVGQPASEILQLPPSFEASLRLDRAQRRPPRIDYLYTRPDGGRIDLGLSASPLVTSGGPTGFIFTFQDLTEIKKLEREGHLKGRLAAVGEMAAGIAHEIRNPLASMSGSIQILRQELPLSDEQRQLMDIVLRESARLNETIRSFLAYARPQRYSTTHLDLRAVLGDTALLLRHSAEFGAGHAVEVEVPDTEVPYEADEGQIRQILWNLATNGLRAMPEGGRLTFSAGADDAGVTLAVTDEGPGIPAEELDRLFQPFHGSFAKGTGLGLAIVHRIVSDYGGEIQVTSQPAKGTTVRIRLPRNVMLKTA